jgi:hypothetical protein
MVLLVYKVSGLTVTRFVVLAGLIVLLVYNGKEYVVYSAVF